MKDATVSPVEALQRLDDFTNEHWGHTDRDVNIGPWGVVLECHNCGPRVTETLRVDNAAYRRALGRELIEKGAVVF